MNCQKNIVCLTACEYVKNENELKELKEKMHVNACLTACEYVEENSINA